MNFLAADAGSATQWILPAVLLVLVIGIFVLNYFRSKKNQESMKNMVDSLKVGDNVKTYSGLYGKIIEIVETTDGKVAILETGSEKNRGIFSIDINAIYGVDEKKSVIHDADGNIIDPDEEKSEVKPEAIEEAKSETEQKPKKKRSKKAEKVVEPIAIEETIVEETIVEETKPEQTEIVVEEKQEKPKKKTTKK